MKKYIIGIVAILVVFGLMWFTTPKQKEAEENLATMSSREIALRQTTDMATKFHIHPELAIFINGEEFPIPHDMGVTASGMTAIHTHDEDGVIHVESPIEKDFTLGDFFAVWNKDFSATKLLDKTTENGEMITVTVNGTSVDTYENTILRDKDKIVISYQAK